MKLILLFPFLFLPVLHAGEAETAPCHTVEPSGEIKDPVFLTRDAATKTANLHITATFDKSNYGMDFSRQSIGATAPAITA